MIEKLEPFPLFETSDEENDTEHEAYAKHQLDKQWSVYSPRLWASILPWRLIGPSVLVLGMMFKYYSQHCMRLGDGSFVATDLHLPSQGYLPFLTFLSGPFLVHSLETNTMLWHFARPNATET